MTKAEKARLIVNILNLEYPDRKATAPLFQSLRAPDRRHPLRPDHGCGGEQGDSGTLPPSIPAPSKLAAAEQNRVEEIIHSTGFYRMKAANIIKTAAALKGRGDRSVPGTMEELTALPGVGQEDRQCDSLSYLRQTGDHCGYPFQESGGPSRVYQAQGTGKDRKTACQSDPR